MKTYEKAKPYYHPDTFEFGIMLYNLNDDDKAFVALNEIETLYMMEGCASEIGRAIRREWRDAA